MNRAVSFAEIIAASTDDDVAMVIASDEFPELAAWLAEHCRDELVAEALARLLKAVQQQAH